MMSAARLRPIAATVALLWACGAGAQLAEPGAGWYLGGGLRPVAPAVEDSDIGYRNFGGFRFSRHWGVELGYSDLGRGNGASEPGAYAIEKFGHQTSAWTLAGTGVLPIGEAFSLQGRLGWSMASPDATAVAAGFGLGTGAPGFGIGSAVARYRSTILWGVGGQYDLSDRFGLRVDYNNFGKLEDQSGTRSDLWSINAVVRF
jgi:OOP family OmpA-OmpF porin